MSDAYTAWSLIRQMADTSSRAEKERHLAELANSELGAFVLRYAYDPFKTYGLKPPAPMEGGQLPFMQKAAEEVLGRLVRRELTGHAAAREVSEFMSSMAIEGQELLFRILSKDLKCGIAAATINTVVPGLVPVFSVMRAHHFEEKRVKSWPQFVEPKYDGYRYTFLCRSGEGGFFSRNGIRQASCDHLVEPMIELAVAALGKSQNSDLKFTLSTRPGDLARYARDDLNFMVDGEMMVPGNFNATGALRRTSETANDAFFQVFDIMSYADFDAVGSVGRPYIERRKLVEELVSYSVGPAITKAERYFVNSIDEIHDLFEKFRARGLEGAMVKNPQGLYDKKKTYGWMKIKPEDTEDLPIVGYYNGEEHTKYEHIMGGAIVQRANGVKVRVGGGWSDEEREQLAKDWEHDAKILGINPLVGFKGVDFESVRNGQQQFNLKFLGRLIEVEFHEETPDGSLRHPRFIRFRDDKAGELESKEAA